jgi:alpha-L-fucosidase
MFRVFFSPTLAVLASVAAVTAAEPAPLATGPFTPDKASLAKYQVPDWFRDAKFGIWSHWGPQAVPRQGDWYARKLYLGPGHMDRKTGKIVDEAGSVYKYHLEHYGHPSVFGFKDIIPLWKAERWDPEALMALYKKAGARYFVSMGVHHDNFALWNSPLHRWNSVNMGPKKDVVGLWQAAAKKQGLRFGVSEHLAASYTWYQPAHASDATGPKAGVPYDGNDPLLADLYHPKIEMFDFSWMSHEPARHANWFARIRELIDGYRPDLLYSDSKLPFQDGRKEAQIKYDATDVGHRLLAHYYNSSAATNNGVADVVYNCKEQAGGRWVQDLERGVMDEIQKEPWQTDTSIGDWYYRTGQKYKTSTQVIHQLADIVSKNGNLLINVVQTPEGDLEPDVIAIVEQIGAWIQVNGEAIYATRPWKIFGEDAPGKAKVVAGNFNEGKVAYTDRDLRFTASKDGKTLYAIALGWPADGTLVLKSLASGSPHLAGKVTAARLLGGPATLEMSRTAEGLRITLPATKPCASAYAVALTLE